MRVSGGGGGVEDMLPELLELSVLFGTISCFLEHFQNYNLHHFHLETDFLISLHEKMKSF